MENWVRNGLCFGSEARWNERLKKVAKQEPVPEKPE